MGKRFKLREGILLPLVLLLAHLTSAANKCNCEGFYCISDSEYQLCVNGEVVGDPIPCVTGAVCRNETGEDCSPHLLCQEVNTCKSEGTFPDEMYINKYYTCILDLNTLEWTRRNYTCPLGTYFSSDSGSCTFVEETATEEDGLDSVLDELLCPGFGSFLDPEDCHRYYMCSGVGVGTRMDCPGGTFFDEKRSVCTSAITDRCLRATTEKSGTTDTTDSTTEEVTDSTTQEVTDPTTEHVTDSTTEEVTDSATQRTTDPTTEEVTDPTTQEVTDPTTEQVTDSTTEEVTDSTPQRTTDPTTEEGTDSTTQEVTDPTTEQVTDSTTEVTDSTPQSTTDPTTEEVTDSAAEDVTYPNTDADDLPSSVRPTLDVTPYPEGDGSSDDEEEGFFCPGEGFFPDPVDCTQYYVCSVLGSHSHVPCPPGTYYDERDKMCSFNRPARCVGEDPNRDTLTTLEPTEGTMATTIEEDETPTVPSYDDDDDDSFICSGEGLFPDPLDCTQYYVCSVLGFHSHIPCPIGTYYDERAQMCSFNRPERCRPSEDETSEDLNLETSTMIRDDKMRTTETTPTTPRPEDENDFTCPSDGFFSDPLDCTRYYVCSVLGSPVLVACPDGTYYDETGKTCAVNRPKRCDEAKHDNQNTVATDPTPTWKPESQRTDPPNQGFICPDEGYYPDQSNCHRYYICNSMGVAINLECPANTYFDEVNDACTLVKPERCGPSDYDNGIPPRPDDSTTNSPQNDHTTEGLTTTSQTRPGVGSQFVCPKDGYFADPENCQSYYVCDITGFAINIECPEGTYFDDDDDACTLDRPERCGPPEHDDNPGTRPPQGDHTTVRPDESTHFECSGEGYFPDPVDCQRYYFCNIEGEGIMIECPDGAYFDEKNDACTFERPERCGPIQDSPPGHDDGDKIPDHGHTTEDSTTTPVPDYQSHFECSGEGYFPDPDNCQRYYVCNTVGSGILIECPDGAYFDEKNDACTLDRPERCGPLQDQDDYPPAHDDDTTTGIPDGDHNATDRPEYETRFECSQEGYFADPENCQRYYVCNIFGNGILIECPDGTYFDERSDACTFDRPERCGLLPDHDDHPPRQDDETVTRVPDYSNITTARPDYETRFECSQEGYFADPENCQRYYVCNIFGNGILIECPDGTYFDERNDACTFDRPERCGGWQRPNEQYGFTCSGEGYYVDPENCGNYYICTPDLRSVRMNCPEGTYFDERISSCTEEIPERCHIFDDDTICPGVGRYPDPQNCRRYFTCTESGSAVSVTCPDDTFFNEKTKSCHREMPERCRLIGGPTTLPPNTFICPGSGLHPDPRDCKLYYICTESGIALPVSCPSGTLFDDVSKFCTPNIPERCRRENVTTPAPEIDFECPGMGYYPDSNNCHNYFICVTGGFPIPVTCPGNEYFDADTNFCISRIPERCQTFETTTVGLDDNKATTPRASHFACPGSGYFPDPDDCSAYYICNELRSETRIECFRGTYYDTEKLSCTKEMPSRCEREVTTSTERPSTQRPHYGDEDFVCPGPGLFPDPNDCRKFWKCYNKDFGYFVLCPKKKYYDENKKFCSVDIPDRCRSRGPGFNCPGEGKFPDPFDCRTYHLCLANGHEYEVRCLGDTYYDPDSGLCSVNVPERCKAPEGGNEFVCPGAGYFPDPRNCSRFFTCNLLGDSVLATCPGNGYYDERIRGCVAEKPRRCQPLDNNGGVQIPSEFVCPGRGYYPDAVDCTKYHVCNAFGRVYTATCPPNTYYHEMFRTCKRTIPLRCRLLGNVHDTSEKPTASDNAFACPAQGLFPDPTSCSRFYVCYGYPRQVTCRDGTYFDEETQQCGKNIPKRCIEEGSDTTTQPSVTLEPADFICPGQGLYPDPASCHSFYACYGSPIRVTCHGGLYYDEVAQQCGYEMPERCRSGGNTQTTTIPPTTPVPDGFVCPSNGLFPNPSDCRKFYVCYGTLREVTCRDGLYFDEETQQCTRNLPERCGGNGGNQEGTPAPEVYKCPGRGLFPDPSSCHSFYVCYDSPVRVTCHNGLYYDEAMQQCSETVPERCRSDDETSLTPPDTSKPNEFVCPGQGAYPDPEDCTKFYVCFGYPRRVSCREGTYFNDASERCENERPARCGGETTPPPTISFQCVTPGRFPDPSDCQRYYFCSWRLEPSLFYCKDSSYFDDITRKCVVDVPRRCRRVESNTAPSPSDFACTDRGYFPDRRDCRKYYFCPGAGHESSHLTCPKNQFFHEAKGKCKKMKDGGAEACQDKERNSERKAEDDENDEDEVDSWEEKESFTCSTPGLFPDLQDCNKFYECSTSLAPTHKTCNFLTTFNEVLRHCSFFASKRCRKSFLF